MKEQKNLVSNTILQIRNIIDDKEYLKVTDEFTKNTSTKKYFTKTK